MIEEVFDDNITEDETQEELDVADKAVEDQMQDQNPQQLDNIKNIQDDRIETEIEDGANSQESKEQAATQSDNEEDVEQHYDYDCPMPDCSKPVPINNYTKAKAEDIKKARQAKDWAKYDEFSLDLHHYHDRIDRERAIYAMGDSYGWPLMININQFPARVAKFAPDILPLITHSTSLVHSRIFRDYIEAIQDDPEILTTENFRTTTPHAG